MNPGVPPADRPLVTAAHDGRRRVVAGCDQLAGTLGVHVGMPLARAQALVPSLAIEPADAEGDARALAEVAAWCLRYAPLTAPDPADGVWLDVTGCAHLFGGEAALLDDLTRRLQRGGLAARAAIADTPGAAWAATRYAGVAACVIPPGETAPALAGLPVAALRLPPEMAATLRRLGFERIGQLADAPRAPLALRFGPTLLQRLDQASGRVFEPIAPVFPPEIVSARLAFVEPLLNAEAFTHVIARLARSVCRMLDRRGEGARRLDLLFERVDGSVQAVRIGTARPARAPTHLARLLGEQLETVAPEPGVEAMRLTVPLSEKMIAVQSLSGLLDAAPEDADIAPLIDRLVNRFGEQRVYRAEPVESDVPERSLRRVAPLAKPIGARWPVSLPRPVRLLDPPQPVEATALLPDQPPVQFVWRRVRHRVRRADGPERIHGEWWRKSAELTAVRDYFAVEDEHGRRFWLFRRGDGMNLETGDLRWFLHGLF